MAATLTVPTIFTAVDKLSGVVKTMGKNIGKFTQTAGSAVNRLNNKFNSFFKLGELQKQFLSLISMATLFAAAVSAVTWGFDGIVQYQKNVASLHALLNNLTDKGFAPYQKAIDDTAKSLDYSSVDTASAFQIITQLNYGLAKTPESLKSVASAAITLSRAAGTDLATSAEGLVTIMKQFNLVGSDSNRIINVLAAGSRFGSSNIVDQIEAYRVFGVVAKNANLSLEKSNTLIQMLASVGIRGSEAGTVLNRAVMRLQLFKESYKDGHFDIQTALEAANKKFHSLSELGGATFLEKLWGFKGIKARQLLQTASNINTFTASITGTNEAFAQAEIRTNNVADNWTKLKNRVMDYLTTDNSMRHGMSQLNDLLKYLKNHIDEIIDTTLIVIKWFLILKGIILGLKAAFWLLRGAILAYNLITGSMTIATAGATAATVTQTTAVGALASSLGIAETAAASLITTLASIVLPTGLLAFIAWRGYKGIEAGIADDHARNPGWDEADRRKEARDPMRYYRQTMDYYRNKNNPSGSALMPGFRQFNTPTALPDTSLNYLKGESYKLPVVNKHHTVNYWGDSGSPNQSNGTITVVIDDPKGNVKSVTQNTPGIGVRVTSTHGKASGLIPGSDFFNQ